MRIDIGNFDGYSGYGIEVRYIKGKYYMQRYYETHNDWNGPRDAIVAVIDQNLVLNKAKYKVGESLYGKIYFHGNVEDYAKTTQFGQGYFRAKVFDLGKYLDSLKAN